MESYPLSELKQCRLRRPDLDVRGWPVIDPDGGQVATVQELLVNPSAAEVQSLRLDDGVTYDVDDVRIDLDQKRIVLRPYDEIAHDVRGNPVGPVYGPRIEVICQESAAQPASPLFPGRHS
jgi:sporulation protein YlmC with PRC-barrel domain